MKPWWSYCFHTPQKNLSAFQQLTSMLSQRLICVGYRRCSAIKQWIKWEFISKQLFYSYSFLLKWCQKTTTSPFLSWDWLQLHRSPASLRGNAGECLDVITGDFNIYADDLKDNAWCKNFELPPFVTNTQHLHWLNCFQKNDSFDLCYSTQTYL